MATIVAFHAHPDDEVLLTGGTLALLAAEGHRVVIAVATDGAMDGPAEAADARLAELRASAGVLGAARVVHLGYADSGHGPVLYPDPPGRVRFARADTDEAATRLAAVLRDESASVLLSYDGNGGYGHRDHVKVHEVGARAAALAGPLRVCEATLPRERIALALRPAVLLRLVAPDDAAAFTSGFCPKAAITHRVDVHRFAAQKRAALAAHQSQVGRAGRAGRLFRLLVRLPLAAFRLLLGYEWFAEPAAPSGTRRTHIL